MSNGFNLSDMMGFEKLIAPRLLKVVYWIGLAGIAIFALMSLAGSLTMLQYSAATALGTMILSIIGFGFAVLFWRVMIEIYIVLFGIYERLGEIRDKS